MYLSFKILLKVRRQLNSNEMHGLIYFSALIIQGNKLNSSSEVTSVCMRGWLN